MTELHRNVVKTNENDATTPKNDATIAENDATLAATMPQQSKTIHAENIVTFPLNDAKSRHRSVFGSFKSGLTRLNRDSWHVCISRDDMRRSQKTTLETK